jgi:hypothetical protein
VYLIFLDDMLNVPEDEYDWGHVVLSCLYFNLSRSCLEPADCIAEPLILLQVVDTIPDRETEVNHYYSPQLKKSCFIHILLAVQV